MITSLFDLTIFTLKANYVVEPDQHRSRARIVGTNWRGASRSRPVAVKSTQVVLECAGR